ncbi:MAG: carbohydrate ABC transporter permease [Mycobacteriales bacterium]
MTALTARPPRRGKIPGLGVTALLVVGFVLLAAPFIWMTLASLKSAPELARQPPTWIPQHPTAVNYRGLTQRLDMPRYFMNSSIVAGIVTVANLVFCSMLGYALAKLRFPGRNKIFGLVLATLMVPSTVLVIPLFALMSRLGLVNTYAALILPFAVGPFGVFLMRQFMLGVPDSLLESGRIDGASEFFLFWRVALPLVTPGLATLGILTFLSSWNNFIWPLIVLNDEQLYTLPVALATFAVDPNRSQGSNGLLMAGSLVVVLPVIVVFIVLQRYFVRGIAMTGIKG